MRRNLEEAGGKQGSPLSQCSHIVRNVHVGTHPLACHAQTPRGTTGPSSRSLHRPPLQRRCLGPQRQRCCHSWLAQPRPEVLRAPAAAMSVAADVADCEAQGVESCAVCCCGALTGCQGARLGAPRCAHCCCCGWWRPCCAGRIPHLSLCAAVLAFLCRRACPRWVNSHMHQLSHQAG
jgi:hypothetical protein